jgi:hypothetical protein
MINLHSTDDRLGGAGKLNANPWELASRLPMNQQRIPPTAQARLCGDIQRRELNVDNPGDVTCLDFETIVVFPEEGEFLGDGGKANTELPMQFKRGKNELFLCK